MSLQLKNTKGTNPARAGQYFRATWAYSLSDVFGNHGFDAPTIARGVQQALPAMGFIPATPPSGIPGDTVVVMTVRLNSSWGVPKTVADVAAQLDRLPDFGTGVWGLNTVLNLSVLEAISSTGGGSPVGGSNGLTSGNEVATQDGNKSNVGFLAQLQGLAGAVGVSLAVLALVAGFAYYQVTKSR